jgi:hypothetical protein
MSRWISWYTPEKPKHGFTAKHPLMEAGGWELNQMGKRRDVDPALLTDLVKRMALFPDTESVVLVKAFLVKSLKRDK